MTERPEDGALRDAVAAHEGLVRETIDFVHAHPELPHEERACAHLLMEILGTLGLEVEAGLAGMETGFRATLEGSRPGRTVGIVALYDAVASVPPEGGIRAVHSCGHGPIAGSVVGALAALAGQRDRLAGRVVVMGCPADEIHAPGTVAHGSGKARSAAAGAWDDIDAAMYAHPEFIDTVSQASLWMRRLHATVAGTRSTSVADAAAPGDAVDAAQAPFGASIEAIRTALALPADRVMLERLELDGDVEQGGGLVSRATFLVWAEAEPGLEELAARLREGIAGATWSDGATVPSIVPDAAVTAAVAEAFGAVERAFVTDPPALPFATDFGAVSRRVPSALIGVGRPDGWAFHTPLGEQQFASEDGVAAALVMAEVLALSAARLSQPA